MSKAPRNKSKQNNTRFHFETKDIDELPFEVRSYVKGIKDFETAVNEYKMLFSGIAIFDNFIAQIAEIDNTLLETKNIIQKYIDDPFLDHLSSLVRDLKDEAEFLESGLDAAPSPPTEFMQHNDFENVFHGVTVLYDRLWARISACGHVLYYHLLSA